MSVNGSMKSTVSGADVSPDTVRVWDIFVRVFHWSLVVSFAAVWLTSDDFVWLHKIFGYAILALIGFRLIWGFAGTRHARFSDFVKSPATVIAFLKDMRAGHEARYIGHNPAGGIMIVMLLLALLVTGVTGWMSTTDAYWGIRWVEILHSLSADVCIVLVGIHVLGVLYTGHRHRENLVKAMITGLKRRN